MSKYAYNHHIMTNCNWKLGKNKQEFPLIESVGTANLLQEQFEDMVGKYFGL